MKALEKDDSFLTRDSFIQSFFQMGTFLKNLCSFFHRSLSFLRLLALRGKLVAIS